MAKEDFYAALGVSRDADESEIKKAYRKLAMKYHPDRNPGDSDAEQQFKDVNEAYELSTMLKSKLIIIPDDIAKLEDYNIPSQAIICNSAREDLNHRIQLYSKSQLNIFQTSGPAHVSLFIKGAKTIMVDAGKGGYDNDKLHWKRDHNLDIGDQPYINLGGYMMWHRKYKDYTHKDLLEVYQILTK